MPRAIEIQTTGPSGSPSGYLVTDRDRPDRTLAVAAGTPAADALRELEAALVSVTPDREAALLAVVAAAWGRA